MSKAGTKATESEATESAPAAKANGNGSLAKGVKVVEPTVQIFEGYIVVSVDLKEEARKALKDATNLNTPPIVRAAAAYSSDKVQGFKVTVKGPGVNKTSVTKPLQYSGLRGRFLLLDTKITPA